MICVRYVWAQNNALLARETPACCMDFFVVVFLGVRVAIYGSQRVAQEGEQKHGPESHHFVKRHFYLDDRLISLPIEAEAY